MQYRAHFVRGLPATLLACLACSLVAGTVHAATYKYTGVAYTQTAGGLCLTTSMSVTASFSMQGKLPANSTNLTVTPLHWRMSDGVNNASNKSAPNTEIINVSTDANAHIVAWQVATQYKNKKGAYILIETANQPPYGVIGDLALDGACKGAPSQAMSTTPGTW